MNTTTPNHVTRFVVTHINRDGVRTLSDPRQGRFTYPTESETQGRIDSIIENTSPDTLQQVHGSQSVGTFEPRACRCYPDHFDPQQLYFDTDDD